jgi:acyl-CoA thioester hydrolase
MNLSTYSAVIRVRLKEVAYDHVYFGAVYPWFEVARTEMSRAAGVAYSLLAEQNLGSFVVEAGARYRRKIPPTGSVRVDARVVEMTRARFSFAYSICPDAGDEPYVTGFTDHVIADLSGRPRRCPAFFADAFQPTAETVDRPALVEPAHALWFTDLRVRYEETDAFGVVYHANYFAWMEAAWSERLADKGWDLASQLPQGRAFPVVESSCRFAAPLRYDDPVRIEVGGEQLGRTRVRLRYRFVSQTSDKTVAIGTSVHAAVQGNRIVVVPEKIIEAFGIGR